MKKHNEDVLKRLRDTAFFLDGEIAKRRKQIIHLTQELRELQQQRHQTFALARRMRWLIEGETASPLIGYARAAWEIQHDNNRPRRLKDMWREIKRRGIALSAPNPTQGNFSAAIATSRHFVKNGNKEYFLVDPNNRWWEKK
jgi:hypothetical protein